MTTLQELRDLHLLKRIMERKRGRMNTNALEREFLGFSVPEERTLVVDRKRLYSLTGDDRAHFEDAMRALKIPGTAPTSTDISGAVIGSARHDAMIFVGLQQVEADHLHPARTYLTPLLQSIFVDGFELLKEFTLTEALCGTVTAHRGKLPLSDIPVFPERFVPGPYTLDVVLDTPSRTVEGYAQCAAMLAELPQRVRDTAFIDRLTALSLSLRDRIGALSRYHVHPNAFSAETSAVVSGSTYYLYAPKKSQNVCVHFGQNPFTTIPEQLMVLNGNDPTNTLQELVRLGIYEPSPSVLEERHTDLQRSYEHTARARGRPIAEEFPQSTALLKKLEDVQRHMRQVINSDIRREYAASLDPSLLEFLLYPSTDDPVVHELLPRLSWNATVREYHDSDNFITTFQNADDTQRHGYVTTLLENVRFRNQQNPTVNRWLYAHHQALCEDAGVQFRDE
jgi:hypothetical protein